MKSQKKSSEYSSSAVERSREVMRNINVAEFSNTSNYKPKVIYLGTPQIAVSPLVALHQSGYEIVGVFCQPDKEKGRGKKLEKSAIKITAEDIGLPVYQPKNKAELHEMVAKLNPDIAIVFAFGMIIPKETLALPSFGFLNIHPSLLPKYRGPSPIQAAILNADKTTGVSIMKLTEGMDEGPVLQNLEFGIENLESTQSLSRKASDLGSKLLLEVLPEYFEGKLEPAEQDNEKATYCKMIKKEDGQIDFSKTAGEIERQIRAFKPWPGSYTFLNNKKIEITEAQTTNILAENLKGLEITKEHILLNTADFKLKVSRLKPEGKNEMSAKDFLNGLKW